MKQQKTPATTKCVLCRKPVTESKSKEHIILAALGGRRTVTGFICRTCNSDAGNTWDATLASSLEDLTRLLDISRERGPVRPKIVHTTQGIPLRVSPGNRIQLGHPAVVEETVWGKLKATHVTARSTDELRAIIRTIGERKKLTQNVDTIVAGRSVHSGYLQEGIEYAIKNPGTDGSRSLVKSVLALMFDAGIDPACANTATSYLKDDEASECIFPYYKTDLVSPRVADMPLNCVYVKGAPETLTLIGYVEIFGFLRRVVRLSDEYVGDYFEHCYALDPTDGVEQRVTIKLDPALISEAERNPHEQEQHVMMEAFSNIIKKAKAKTENNEFERLIEKARAEWYGEHGKELKENLTEEECLSLSSHITETVTPYALHLMRPMLVPEEAFASGSWYLVGDDGSTVPLARENAC